MRRDPHDVDSFPVPSLTQAQTNAMHELLRIAPVIDDLGSLFRTEGHQLYLVGGSVRDALLGSLGHDLDFTTSASPDQTHELLKRFTHSTWDIGKEFGTIGALKRAEEQDWQIEVTTFRADIYRSESRKPEVSFGDTIDGDLLRRDFTVNAMAVDISTRSFVDPYGGLADLADGLLRTPSTPEHSFSDDPLRMMRAARFASRLGFRVAPEVVQAMTDMAERITIVSAERVQGELTGLLLTDNPRVGLDLLVRTGIAEHILPELPALQLEVDEHARHKDVYQHSLTVVDQAIELEKARGHEPDIVNRLAALLHDIGKPATRKFEGPKVTFHHHDIVGAKLATRRLKALNYPTHVVKSVAKLIELHLRFHGYSDGEWTDAAVRRYVRDAGDELELLHMLTRADCTTRNRQRATKLRRAYEELEWRIDELSAQEELASLRPHLDGTQIMEILAIPPGRAVGEAYAFLLEHRTEHGPVPHDEAVALLTRWWADRAGR